MMIDLAKRRSTKGRRFPVETLSRDEISRLMGAFSRRGSAGIRDRALTCLLWRSGLRIGEALDLRLKDIDADKCTITVLRGKGGKRRVVGIDPAALAVLDIWLARRKKLGIGSRATIFCTLRGGKLNAVAVRASLKRAARKAGIEKRTHPHGLRHTHASELRGEGVDIGVISKQLGHSSIATTSRYVDHLTRAAVVETMRAREWESSK